MTVPDVVDAEPLRLVGDPYARGRAQATLCPDMVDHVRHAITHRLAETAAALGREDVRGFIAEQRRIAARIHPEILEEIRGIADGFGVEADTLFDYLHCSSAADLAAIAGHRPDGCTAIAVTADDGGAIVAKNRDYRDEHIAIQRVMLHDDPAWGGRRLLVIGSLGSPGNFSSGMNGDGLAVADTASRTRDMGPGFHRYFLLTWLLVNCRSVDEALRAIRDMPHTGSGLLLLGDASGAVAAVELGHARIGFEHRSSGRVGRTNHFVTPAMAPSNLDVGGNPASRANSQRRFAAMRAILERDRTAPDLATVRAFLARHRDGDGEGFCRHGEDDLSTTIAGAIWDTRTRRLLMTAGNPCSARWRRYELGHDATQAAPD